ncbi:hypothetical protein B1987_08930 [Mycobacterium kansasii]|nr:hypothetical protein B1987_08930 [Mycobacterium kansasii]
MSATYAAVYPVMLLRTQQVVAPFDFVRLANRAPDEIRRRGQREHKCHRGRRRDTLNRAASC